MGRELQHSAEGTHWTKKNHKYIRKEGNRYIYADDANKLRRTQATNRQGTTDYRSIGTDRAKRSQASNGVGARNQEFAKAQSGLQRTKQLYKSTGGKVPMEYKVGQMTLRRAQTPTPNTAVEKAKAITQQRNRLANGNGVRNQEYAKNSALQRKRSSALNRQGNWRSPNGYEYAKRENDWTSGSPGTISAKRKKAMYQQGSRDVPSYGTTMNTLGSADRARKANWFRPHFGNSDLDSLQKDVNTRDYSKSVKADRGKTFVNSLREKFGPMNKKKDQLVKKAKDFFNRIKAKNTEKSVLNKMYDERSGRPKSYTTHDAYGNYVKGQDPNTLLGPTTGNAGSSNLRKGVEAGRKRAGIKNSPQVHGVKNNLSNRGYETTNYDNDHDTYRGLHNNRNTFGPEAIDSQRWKDMVTSTSKQKDEEYRKRIDESRSRATGQPNELARGTSAGRKRVKNKTSRNKSRNYAAKNNR